MKRTGLIIFLSSFAFFISLLFLGKYSLSKESLLAAIGEEERVSYITRANGYEELSNTTFSNPFEFVSKVKSLLGNANEIVIKENGITKEEVNTLIYHATLDQKVAFTQESVDKTFDVNTPEGAFKNKKIKDNLGWMYGKEFKTITDFQDKVNNKIASIEASIIQSKGFDENKIQGLVFAITKSSTNGFAADNKGLVFFLTFILTAVGGLLYIIPGIKKYPGIKNDGIYHNPATNIGWIGILMGTFLITFYIALYWFPEYITNWIIIVDPLSKSLSGNEASQWFLYGFLYCLAMTVMGIRMIVKYRHNKYQIIRTISVWFFQIGFAFLIPEILVRLNQPYFDFKNMWPLDYDFFFDWNIKGHLKAGSLGIFMLIWGICLFVIGVPLFVYFFGKRWYCSWVCGCGGLAETLGDPYRQLSDKSVKAWKMERYLIHGVLVFAVVMTAATLYSYFSGSYTILGVKTAGIQKTYGFMIGSVFSGVVGTGFYPLMGNRTWCRFGCPLAAYLGLVQRFKSRFRITTNGGQCISCGNCSTYCEMGIDVRSYAQKGQNIVRSSCVGCGVCSAVCPRGVLKLENGPTANRVNDNPIIIGNDGLLKLNQEL